MFAFYGEKKSVALNSPLYENYDWYVRAFAVLCVALTIMCHAVKPKIGIFIQDVLSVLKIGILFMVIVTGVAAACGLTNAEPTNNFENMFATTTFNGSNMASALFAVFFAFDGWNNLNYCLDGELTIMLVQFSYCPTLSTTISIYTVIASYLYF
jgi:amino acid transporter